MELTDQNIEWALEQLSLVAYLPGFPATESALKTLARSFLRIIGDQPVHRWEVDNGVFQESTPYTAQETADWLIGQITDTCVRFPAAITMRLMYEKHGWRPGDGRSASELTPPED
jgi:hypothetical protein